MTQLHRQAFPNTLLRRPQVSERTGLPKSTLYMLMQQGQFPRPVKVGVRAVAWPSSLIDEWVTSRQTA